MNEGLYSGEFETPFGKGTGVLYFSNGTIHGGNSALYYIGKYQADGNTFQSTLRTKRYANNVGIASVFGMDDITIEIEGVIDGDTISIDGFATEVPDMQMRGKLVRIHE